MTYTIFHAVASPLYEVWLCPSDCPGTWHNINGWDTLGEARAAVARYTAARQTARDIGFRP